MRIISSFLQNTKKLTRKIKSTKKKSKTNCFPAFQQVFNKINKYVLQFETNFYYEEEKKIDTKRIVIAYDIRFVNIKASYS